MVFSHFGLIAFHTLREMSFIVFILSQESAAVMTGRLKQVKKKKKKLTINEVGV